jgi:Cyclophilin-like
MTRIRITWPKGEAIAVLDDTPSTRKLLEALPWESSANIWGDEVYFSVPMETEQEADACQMVAPGTVCFWVGGGLLALPFGPRQRHLATAVTFRAKRTSLAYSRTTLSCSSRSTTGTESSCNRRSFMAPL